MFDDIPSKNPTPPQNLPTEPVDMFAGVEGETEPAPGTEGPSALDVGVLKKRAPGVQTPPAELAGGTAAYAVKEPVLGKVIGIFIFIIVAAGVGYGAWRLYSYFGERKTAAPANLEGEQTVAPTLEEPSVPPEENEGVPVVTTTEETATGTSEVAATSTEMFREPEDTDNDGLDDAREEELGTDMNKADSDGDGLIDGDEVIIWKTNPTNPDTDGDSYLDGDEVRHGYNPLGPGKLFNGETPVGTSTTSTATTTNEVDL